MSSNVAIITGASSGIGRAVAIELAKMHYNIILIARNSAKLNTVHEDIMNLHKEIDVSIHPLDVSNEKDINKCIEEVIQKYKKIDVLFNNAGIAHIGTTTIKNEDLIHMLNVNLLGAIFIGNAVANHMKEQKSGYIINLSSIGGKTARPMMGGYNASKFGLVGYGSALTQEMIEYGVRVTTLCPAMTNTQMVSEIIQKTHLVPAQLIQPEDIAKTVSFLLSMNPNVAITELVLNSTIMMKTEVQNQMKNFNQK